LRGIPFEPPRAGINASMSVISYRLSVTCITGH
jgi:hypothetical protein